jgi:hypothetical protein
MTRTKIASAYKAAEKLSVLARLSFSTEKTAEMDVDDLKAHLVPYGVGTAGGILLGPVGLLAGPAARVALAPEGRGMSRLGYGLLGSGIGGAGGSLAGGILSVLSGGKIALGRIPGLAGALVGGLKGTSVSRSHDPLYIQALRELGVDGYEY